MTDTAPRMDRPLSPQGGGLSPNTIQRVEGGLITALAMTATIIIDPGLWWFPIAAFLVFDVSTVGYVQSPAVGAFWYNAVHTYSWPAILAVIALATRDSSPSLSKWVALIALAWALHVGVDRMLGYGLKLPDAFIHTHLGRVGKARSTTGNSR